MTENNNTALSHPQHYAVTRPYAGVLKKIGENPQAAVTILEKMGAPAEGDLTRTKAIILSCLSEIEQLNKSGALPNSKEVRLWMQQEPHDAQIYSMFCGNGRMIFNFSEELTEAFSHSDIGEAAVKDVKLPFQAFYLRFNFGNPQLFYNGRPFDGTYVFQGRGAPFIGLLLVSGSGEIWPDILDLGIHSAFETADSNKLLSVALDEAFLSQKMQFEQMRAKVAEDYGFKAEDIDLPQEDFYTRGHGTVKSLFHLIGNALLYLSVYPTSVDVRWPLETPEILIKKTQSTKLKERKSAFDELWAQGYAKIRYCKTETSESNHLFTDRDINEDKKLARHWRRGHWRNQPYGAGSKQRRLMWIRPCLVGFIEKPRRGREYQVE
jgi:hypothetical protein